MVFKPQKLEIWDSHPDCLTTIKFESMAPHGVDFTPESVAPRNNDWLEIPWGILRVLRPFDKEDKTYHDVLEDCNQKTTQPSLTEEE